MEAAAAGGTSNSDLQDNSEKPVLSHTVSLPSPTSAADGGIAGVLVSDSGLLVYSFHELQHLDDKDEAKPVGLSFRKS